MTVPNNSKAPESMILPFTRTWIDKLYFCQKVWFTNWQWKKIINNKTKDRLNSKYYLFCFILNICQKQIFIISQHIQKIKTWVNIWRSDKTNNVSEAYLLLEKFLKKNRKFLQNFFESTFLFSFLPKKNSSSCDPSIPHQSLFKLIFIFKFTKFEKVDNNKLEMPKNFCILMFSTYSF